MNEFKDKVVIVTGGTSGIGKAVCELICEEGGIAIACARHSYDFLESNIKFKELNVTDEENCRQVVESVINEYGRIDGLVCSAGISKDAMTHKMTEDMFDATISVNLKGAFNMVKYAGRHMAKVQKKGSIVLLSSIVGQYGNAGQCSYAATKAGLVGMQHVWAKELSHGGVQVRVNSVAPSYTVSEMLENVPKQMLADAKGYCMLGRLGTCEEVAEGIAFLLSDRASYITDVCLDIQGGTILPC